MAQDGTANMALKLVSTSAGLVFALTWYFFSLTPALVVSGLLVAGVLAWIILRARARAIQDPAAAGEPGSQVEALREIWMKKYGYICGEETPGHAFFKYLLGSEPTRQYFVASEVKWVTDPGSLMPPYAVVKVRTRRDEGREAIESEEIPTLIKAVAAGLFKYAPVAQLTQESIIKEQKAAFPFFFIFQTHRDFVTAEGQRLRGVDKEVTVSVDGLKKVEAGLNREGLHRVARVELSPHAPIRSDGLPFAERNTPGRFKARPPLSQGLDPEHRQELLDAAGHACQVCGAKEAEGAVLDVAVDPGSEGAAAARVLCATCRRLHGAGAEPQS